MSIRMDTPISDREEKTYPHLSPDRLQDFNTIGATVEQIERADHVAKKEIDGRLMTYTLGADGQEVHDDRPKLTLVVIGTSGSGKSATANTLLKEKILCESTSATSQATEFKVVQSRFDSLLTVVDTPGAWVLPNTKEHHIDLYILTINLASPRFGKQDLDKIRKLKDYNNIMKSKRCIVLLTHASDALQGKSLYEYVQEIKGDPLYDLILKDMEGKRVMAINNSCDTKYEADKQHEMIVKHLWKTFEEANLNADNTCRKAWNSTDKVFLCAIVAAILLAVYLSVWYTTHVPPALITTTMQPHMTTVTTAPITTTDTAGTGTTQSPATGTSGTYSKATVTTTTATGTAGTHSSGTGTSGTHSKEPVTTTAGTGDSTADKKTGTTGGGTAATQTRDVGTNTSQEPPTRKVKSGG